MSSDIRLDLATGDLTITQGRLSLAVGADAVVQSLRIRFRTFLGEWFLDSRVGVPWFQLVFVKHPNLRLARAVLRQVALATPGVVAVRAFSVSLDDRRRCAVEVVAITTAGEVPIGFGDVLSSPNAVVRLLAGACSTRSEGAGALGVSLTVDAGLAPTSWANGVAVLAGVGASGGTGSYTYEWTVQSGGAGVFGDDTSLISTFTPSAPSAAIVLRLTVHDGASTAYDEIVVAATWDAVVTNGTGFTRHVWLEVSAANVTLNGANVSQLNDRWGTYHCTQATASLQPLYVASGGPNNLPYTVPNDADDILTNTAISLSSGRRIRMYFVVTQHASGVMAPCAVLCGPGDAALYRSGGSFVMEAEPEPGGLQQITLSSPAADTAWHTASIEFLASGLVGKLDGAAISPAFTGTSGCDSVDAINVGDPRGSGGGHLFLVTGGGGACAGG